MSELIIALLVIVSIGGAVGTTLILVQLARIIRLIESRTIEPEGQANGYSIPTTGATPLTLSDLHRMAIMGGTFKKQDEHKEKPTQETGGQYI